MGNCDTEKSIYLLVTCLSFALTFGVAVYRRKQRSFVDNRALGRKCYLSVGIVKIVLGFLLLTVLYPWDCRGFDSAYGAVAMMIGIYWLILACKLGACACPVDTSSANATAVPARAVSEMPPMKATSTTEIV